VTIDLAAGNILLMLKIRTCGPCNNEHYLGHVKNVYDDDVDK